MNQCIERCAETNCDNAELKNRISKRKSEIDLAIEILINTLSNRKDIHVSEEMGNHILNVVEEELLRIGIPVCNPYNTEDEICNIDNCFIGAYDSHLEANYTLAKRCITCRNKCRN